jgi:hypothetical protein
METLPPPHDDSPEALRARNHSAIAKVAALLPVNANEIDLAPSFACSVPSLACSLAQCIAAHAPAEEDSGAEPRQAAVTGAAPVGAPVAAPACGLDQRIAANVSQIEINSQRMAFETWMSAQPWTQGSRRSGETDLRAVMREAMAESRLRGREWSASGRESAGMAN